MYSYDDRLRAVKLYLKLGKRCKATINQLGYPTKGALRAWVKEYFERGDLRITSTRSKRKYSPEQKEIAIKHWVEHGRCFAFTLKELGYPNRKKLTSWVRGRYPETRKCVTGTAKRPAASLSLKRSAVYELCTRTGSAGEVASRLDVDRVSLYNWKHQLLGQEVPASMKQNKFSSVTTSKQELEQEVERLKRELHELQLEHDLLERANDILKKDLGVDMQLLSNREKMMLVDALKDKYGVRALLQKLELARSSYFYHRSPKRITVKYAQIRSTITEIFEDNHWSYGYRRIQASLMKQQIFISEKVIQRLMRQENLKVPIPKRRRYSSYLGEISPAPENIINRDFHAEAPNQKWLTDITEFQIPAGKVYLSPIIDCFDGMVVSWSVGTSPDANLVNTMLDAAIETVADTSEKPVVHSDRGSHYRWPGWLSRVADAGLIRSMSRKACSPDNAACEGFFGRLKNEMFYPRDWRPTTITQFIDDLESYIHWYNEKRIKKSLGYLSPMEYRQMLGLNT